MFNRERNVALTNESPASGFVAVIQFIVRGTCVVLIAVLAPIALIVAWGVDLFDKQIEQRRRNPTLRSWNNASIAWSKFSFDEE